MRFLHFPNWLVILLAVTFILRIPSFFEPYWYGDEQIYLTIGQNLKKGLLLYRDIYDNKPPLIYLLTAVAGNLFWMKAILAFWNLVTILLFYKLGKILFGQKESLIRFSIITLAILTTIPLLEGNIFNAELLLIGTTIASFTILFSGQTNWSKVFLAGLIMGIGALLKIPAFIDAAMPLVIWLAYLLTQKQNLKNTISYSIVWSVAVIFPLVSSLLIMVILGAGKEYINSAFLQTVGYLSAWRGLPAGEAEIIGDFWMRNQPLILRGLSALAVIAILLFLYQRKKMSFQFLFVSVWFVYSLFAALLSERPYPHYLIQIVPSLSFLLGIMLFNKTKEQFYPYPLLTLLGGALVFYQFSYYASFPYYENFLSFATGKRTQQAYLANFDPRTPRNYQVAQYLVNSSQADDLLFVWGDDPEIYALTKLTPATRLTVAYHVKDLQVFEETAKIFQENPPRFIVTTRPEEEFRELSSLLSKNYATIKQIDHAKIWLNIGR